MSFEKPSSAESIRPALSPAKQAVGEMVIKISVDSSEIDAFLQRIEAVVDRMQSIEKLQRRALDAELAEGERVSPAV